MPSEFRFPVARILCVVFPILFGAALACRDPAGTGNLLQLKPLTFPKTAFPGETVGVVVDSNYAPLLDQFEEYTLSTENVTLEIEDDFTVHSVSPRAVFRSEVPRESSLGSPGAWMTVVVFDLPTAVAFSSYPGTAEISVLKDGQVLGYQAQAGLEMWTLEVFEEPVGGVTQTSFWPFEDIESPSMIRLRAREVSGEFEDGIEIGAMEFEIVYPAALLETPRIFPGTEAVNATIAQGEVVDEGGGDRSVRVLLVEPRGFMLSSESSGTLGNGPLIEIAFDRLASFDTTDVQIRSLYVVDPDGESLIDRRGSPDPDSSDLFDFYAVKNGGS